MTITAEDIIERFNKHPRKNEIINDFNKNWAKRAKKRTVDAGLKDKKDLVAGYHYFECPITGIGHLSYKNAYFNRIRDICTKEEFEEAFFSVEGLDKAPYQAQNFSATWQQNNANKQASKPKLGTKTVNGHTFDMDHYYDVYSTMKDYIARRKTELGNEWIKGYSYFECPVSGEPIGVMMNANHLKALNITPERFADIFPEIDVTFCKTPKARKFTYEQYLRNEHIKEYKKISEMTNQEHEELSTRFMHITDRDKYIKAVNDDHYGKSYKNSKLSSTRQIDEKYPNGVVGVDYFVCPVFGFKYEKYNSGALRSYGVTEDRLREWFPEMSFSSTVAHKDTIINGLNVVDATTGLTKHQQAANKAKLSRNIVGEDGLTPNQRIGISTKETHQSKLDEYGRNGQQRLADNSHEKRMKTRYGDTTKPYNRRQRYERIIELMTNRCRILYDYLGDNNIEWSSYRDNNHPDAMQLDHKFSRHEGYNHKISPVCIGHFHNIEYMKAKDNFKKKNDCSITVQDLATMNHMTVKDMEDEFDKIMAVIDDDIANDRIHISMNVLIRAGQTIALKIKPYNILKHTCQSVKMDKQTKDTIISDIITKL